MRVLVVNTGSSSLKLRLLGPDDHLEATLDLDPWHGDVAGEELAAFTSRLEGVGAVGHRVVHGGDRFTSATLIDDSVAKALATLSDLAPLHQPRALAAIAAVRPLLPGIPQVACFDTAFHAGLPQAAATYALPGDWRARFGLRRYGFHGLSHAYAARRAAQLLAIAANPAAAATGAAADSPRRPRMVVCHLGAGASLAAVRGGRCVDTTMGFTPMEGLVMATRPGNLDPGLVLWLLQHARLPLAEVAGKLEHGAGLAGLAELRGGSGDMRDVRLAAEAGDPRAALAIDVYLHRLRREIAAMAAAMDGFGVLVFTGGIGEHDPGVRSGAAAGLGFLGVRIDPQRNADADGDADISANDAEVRSLVITSREDLEVARQVRGLLAGPRT
jgi:acetate kinase